MKGVQCYELFGGMALQNNVLHISVLSLVISVITGFQYYHWLSMLSLVISVQWKKMNLVSSFSLKK